MNSALFPHCSLWRYFIDFPGTELESPVSVSPPLGTMATVPFSHEVYRTDDPLLFASEPASLDFCISNTWWVGRRLLATREHYTLMSPGSLVVSNVQLCVRTNKVETNAGVLFRCTKNKESVVVVLRWVVLT